MPAIRKNQTPLTPPPVASHIGPKHNQPPAFRATGKGYFNQLPRFPADAKIANGVLVNRATPPSNALHTLYLFVDAVETGWQLSGETTQSQTARNFYPRNMAQDELTISGTVANQYEYDRIVEFIQHHHLSQFNSGLIVAQGLDGNGNYPGVDFKLFRPQAGGTNSVPRMFYTVVITDIAAGHERFMNYPTYQLTAKVTYDHLQKDESVDQSLNYLTTVKDVYGNVLPPVLSNGNSNPKNQKQRGKKKAT